MAEVRGNNRIVKASDSEQEQPVGLRRREVRNASFFYNEVEEYFISSVCGACYISGATFAQVPGQERVSVCLIVSMVDDGQFDKAEATLAAAVQDDSLDEEIRAKLLFERERMRRILIDFALDEDSVRDRLRAQVPGLREEEFTHWKAAKRRSGLSIGSSTAAPRT